MRFRMCVDAGGTFTDIVSLEERSRAITVFKTPSTPHDPAEAIVECLKLASHHYGMTLQELTASIGIFTIGTTIGTNAIITCRISRTGAILTRGFRDILLLREGGKHDPFNLNVDYPGPYVPRHLTMPLNERITSEGVVLVPLDEEEVRNAILFFKQNEVEAIGVCLLWSIVNPVHEIRIGEIIREEWPSVSYTLSHELNPVIREYRRASSTVIDASIKPIMSLFVKSITKRLREYGYKGEPYFASSNGGIIPAEEASKRPIYTVGSGPAMAPVSARVYGSEIDVEDIISVDTGGTSFDVGLIRGGHILLSRETWVGEEFVGHMLGISAIDVKSLGAGGGSIAWVDSGGLLHVGPQSAAAYPGPACYMRGGKLPTVTDAAVLLGYINPDYFLGGRMKIDPSLSVEAISKHVAEPMNLDLVEAAFSILAVVSSNMVSAVEDVTVRQGIDPRKCLLIAGGSASGMNIGLIASQLKIKKILVPRTAAAYSAAGGLFSDIRSEFTATFFAETYRFDYGGVNKTLELLEYKGKSFLDESHVPESKRELEFFVEARYPNQVWEIEVPLRSNRVNSDNMNQLVARFHDVHEQLYAIKEPGQHVECLNWRVRATGKMPKPKMRAQLRQGSSPARALKGKRSAFFRGKKGSVKAMIYDGPKLSHGNKIAGPAIIEEPNTTIVLYPRSRASVTKWGDYLIELS